MSHFSRRLLRFMPPHLSRNSRIKTAQMPSIFLLLLLTLSLNPFVTQAQTAAPTPPQDTWEHCRQLSADAAARLACFDAWAEQHNVSNPATMPISEQNSNLAQPAIAEVKPAPLSILNRTSAMPMATEQVEQIEPEALTTTENCRDRHYALISRYWDLERATSCGLFRFRGYRPISLSVIGSDFVNAQPSSDSPDNSATTRTPYRKTEARIQMSIRTKVAANLLTRDNPTYQDSIWFGYTQQSYWQIFTPELSRPFRNTDHEPEIIYIYPTQMALAGDWVWRYGGVGAVHQSNGQSLPLSRSWNRVYATAGFDNGQKLHASVRLWHRLSEHPERDDNPRIQDYIGRGEFGLLWNMNQKHTLKSTALSTLSRAGRGSLRLEWLSTIGDPETSNLRFHTQLFSGYGDSLLDYNRKRTVLGIGISLVDF